MSNYISVCFKVNESFREILSMVNDKMNGDEWEERIAFHSKNLLGMQCVIRDNQTKGRANVYHNFTHKIEIVVSCGGLMMNKYLFDCIPKGTICYYSGFKEDFFKESFLPKVTPDFTDVIKRSILLISGMRKDDDYSNAVTSNELENLFISKKY